MKGEKMSEKMYLFILKTMCYSLFYNIDKKKSKELFQSEDVKTLESVILEAKEKTDTSQFYFDCGRALENALSNVDSEQKFADITTAISMFKKLIGLK